MNGLIQKLQGEFTDDTLPRYYPKDNMLNKGTIFMFDFSKDTCYLSQAPTVANGTVLKNLVDGAPDATVAAGTGISYTAGKGFKFNDTTAAVNLGLNYDLNALGNVNVLLNCWVKLPGGAEENTNQYQRIIGRNGQTNANTYQLGMDTGQLGNRVRVSAANGTVIQSRGTSNVQPLDTVLCLSGLFETNTLRFFINNVEQGAGLALTGPLFPFVASWIAGQWAKGTIYRFSLENLTASGNSGVAQVAAEYARNTGKFS